MLAFHGAVPRLHVRSQTADASVQRRSDIGLLPACQALNLGLTGGTSERRRGRNSAGLAVLAMAIPVARRRFQKRAGAPWVIRAGTPSSSGSAQQQLEFEFEELEQADPGRSALKAQWAGPGSSIAFEEQSPSSGLIRVYSSPSSCGGSWRRMRFNDKTDQSTVLLDKAGEQVGATLAFGYLKTLAAVGAATARALGRFPPDSTGLRVLVLGFGGGALPHWFASQLGAQVDAVDLDDAVMRAATSAMGFPQSLVSEATGATACAEEAAVRAAAPGDGATAGGKLRAYCCDGAEFVLAAAALGSRLSYDVVIMDIFDGEGQTPGVFLEEAFAQALGKIAHCAVANLTCPVPMNGGAGSVLAQGVRDQRPSVERAGGRRRFCVGRVVEEVIEEIPFHRTAGIQWLPVGVNAGAVVYVVLVLPPSSSCRLLCAEQAFFGLREGAPPPEYLAQAARELASEGLFAFDPVRRVAFERTADANAMFAQLLCQVPAQYSADETIKTAIAAASIVRIQGQYDLSKSCQWPDCAPVCEDAPATPMGSCKVPGKDKCVWDSSCIVGTCFCNKGTRPENGACVAITCSYGAMPPKFEAPSWVKGFAGMGPTPPPANADANAWKSFAFACAKMPFLLCVLGIAMAATTCICIQGHLECECSFLPTSPVVLLALCAVTVTIIATGVTQRVAVVNESMALAETQLS
ncbi:unnamed protein product, partial [Polarella glacialis]